MKCQIVGVEPVSLKDGSVLYNHSIIFEVDGVTKVANYYKSVPLKTGDAIISSTFYVSRGTLKSKVVVSNA